MRCWPASTERREPQPKRESIRRSAVAVVLSLGLVLGWALPVPTLAATSEAAVEAPQIRFGRHPGFQRMALEWRQAMPATVAADEGVVVVDFGRPAAPETFFAGQDLHRRLAAVVRHVEATPERLAFFLREGVAVESLTLREGRILALDFTDAPRVQPAPSRASALVPRRRDGPPPAPATAVPPAASRDVGQSPAAPVDAADALVAEPAPARPWAAADRPVRPAPQPVPALPNADRWATVPPAGSEVAPVETEPAPAEVTVRDDESPAPVADLPIVAPPPEPETAAAPEVVPEPDPPSPEDAQPVVGLMVTATAEGWHFATSDAVPAAIWRRGRELWVVLPAPDTPEPIVLVDVEASQIEHDRAWVLRFDVDPGIGLEVERDDGQWHVRRGRTESLAPSGAGLPDLDDAPRLRLHDPWLDTTLDVIPVREPGIRVHAPLRDGARNWLPTLQGAVVYDPSSSGPVLSDSASFALPPRPELGPLLGLAGPTRPEAEVREARLELERALFEDPAPERRLALVRFLLGEAMPFDALAVLDAAPPSSDGEIAERLQALAAVAAILAGRARDGFAALPDPALHDDPELWLWRAIAAGRMGEVEESGADFARSGQAWRAYPPPLRREVALHAGRTALALDAPQIALALLDHVRSDAGDAAADGELMLLRAETMALRGQRGEAQALLLGLEATAGPDLARRARFVRHRLTEERWGGAGPMALAELEDDLPAWRGHPEEAAVWRLVGTMRAAAGDGLGALEAWAEARRAAPERDPGPRSEERELLAGLVAGEPPFDQDLAAAVTAVHRYPDLLPPGADRARLLDGLAERVARESDALHVADSLLVHALTEPMPRALEQALRLHLAELRLRRHVPAQALEALAPLADVESAAVAELRERAQEERVGSARPVPPSPASGEAPSFDGDSVDDALAAARALLEGAP